MMVELVLVVPILVILVSALMQFSLLLTARQQLLAASREGARVASHGGNLDDVSAAVHRVLGSGNLSGSATVSLCQANATDETDHRERVQVCVRVPALAASPDLLQLVGISFQGEELIACTVMLKE
jgi:Flp pilus assembly protein TadG